MSNDPGLLGCIVDGKPLSKRGIVLYQLLGQAVNDALYWGHQMLYYQIDDPSRNIGFEIVLIIAFA